MRDDQPAPVTFAMADCQADLRVIGLCGKEALNEVYRYDVDLVSTDPHLDIGGWPGREAVLSLGLPGCDVHGYIVEARQRHAGTCLSHYRLSLKPGLERLARRTQRRVHQQLTVPELIMRLLEEHDIEPAGYRFKAPVGLYPLQATHVQYDETDLHFLQRVCEQEGIHFHFEHRPEGHVQIFADDPSRFPEHSPPLHVAPPGTGPSLEHMARVWSIPSRCQNAVLAGGLASPWPGVMPQAAPDDGARHACNQTMDEPAALRSSDLDAGLARQRTVRALERMRGGHQGVHAVSTRPDVRSGRIIKVLDHPEGPLNDQWLVVAVNHFARQLDTLEGLDPHDIAAILTGLAAEETGSEPRWATDDTRHGYWNTFDAEPWAMAWRPPLKRMKPHVTGEQPATLMGSGCDAQGRMPIRYDWQTYPAPGSFPAHWPLADVLRGSEEEPDHLHPGARVLVAHFDGDPDRPVICGLLPDFTHSAAIDLHVDGLRADAALANLSLESGQRLDVLARQPLTLRGAQVAIELSEDAITVHGVSTMQAIACSHPHPATAPVSGQDLQLTDLPGLRGAPRSGCSWYIVRMARPGFEYLPRIEPQDILFEGTTDAQGFLGLAAPQLRRLAALYHNEAQALCLVYPGTCVTLHQWFEQNWTERQRRAFRISGL